MPLSWREYDREVEFRGAADDALSAEERLRIEAQAAAILEIAPDRSPEPWGEVLGYGLRSRALIRVRPGVLHRYERLGKEVALKLFRNAADTLVAFHRAGFRRLPGLPGNHRIQQTLDAGHAEAASGRGPGYAVLEYVPGIPLSRWLLRQDAVPKADAAAILGDLFRGIWIPLWAMGHRFWDLRPDNLVVDPPWLDLRVIDTDLFRKSFDELTGPDAATEWRARDRQEDLALRRLPGSVISFILTGRRGRTSVARTVAAALAETGLATALRGLGRSGGASEEDARGALRRFIRRLTERGLL